MKTRRLYAPAPETNTDPLDPGSSTKLKLCGCLVSFDADGTPLFQRDLLCDARHRLLGGIANWAANRGLSDA